MGVDKGNLLVMGRCRTIPGYILTSGSCGVEIE